MDEKYQYDIQAGDERANNNQQYTDFRRVNDIDERDGDDTQTLEMLEAEQTFSECEDQEIAT